MRRGREGESDRSSKGDAGSGLGIQITEKGGRPASSRIEIEKIELVLLFNGVLVPTRLRSLIWGICVLWLSRVLLRRLIIGLLKLNGATAVGSGDVSEGKKKKKAKKENLDKMDSEEKNLPSADKGAKQSKAKPAKIRTFPNGLAIEELQMGRPDGKRASRGNKDLMEKTIVFALATGQKNFSSSLCKLVEKYAEILASQGQLSTSMEYLKILGEDLSPELVILRDRIAGSSQPGGYIYVSCTLWDAKRGMIE